MFIFLNDEIVKLNKIHVEKNIILRINKASEAILLSKL